MSNEHFVIGLALAMVAIGFSSGLADWQQGRELRNLRARVDCLEHPHGESSIAGRFVRTGSHRRFVVTQPAHQTGCTP